MLLPTHRCFVYGTLMSPQVLKILLDRVPQMDPRPAVLPPAYTRHPVKGRVFPAVISNKSTSQPVHGILLTDVTSEERKVLDWFEADEYDRLVLPIELQGESPQTVDAHVYIWSAGESYLDLESSWSFETFCKDHLEWYLHSTVLPCRRDYDRHQKRSAPS